MKPTFLRTLPVAALFLVAALAAAPAAHAQLGVAAGANFDRLGDIQDDQRDLNFDNATGYHVGLTYEIGAGPLRVRPGIFYMDVGSFNFDSVDDAGQDIQEEFNLSLVEVPIDLRYRLLFPLVKPYVTVGPVLRFPTDDGGDDFPGEVEDFSMAANVGGGVEVGLPGTSVSVFPELRYSFGINDIASDFGLQGEDDSSRLNNFMLRLGVTF